LNRAFGNSFLMLSSGARNPLGLLQSMQMFFPAFGDKDAIVCVILLDVDTVGSSFVLELSFAQKRVRSCQRDLMVDMYRSTGNINEDGSSTVHGRLFLLAVGML
jgi:hypothetical protein